MPYISRCLAPIHNIPRCLVPMVPHGYGMGWAGQCCTPTCQHPTCTGYGCTPYLHANILAKTCRLSRTHTIFLKTSPNQGRVSSEVAWRMCQGRGMLNYEASIIAATGH